MLILICYLCITFFFVQKDVGSTSLSENSQRNIPETESFIEALPVSAHRVSFLDH